MLDEKAAAGTVTSGEPIQKVLPPYPEADLMHVVDLLPAGEQARYAEVREFLQRRIRAASIEYWNREEFPFGLLAEMAKYGFGGPKTKSFSKPFQGLKKMYDS